MTIFTKILAGSAGLAALATAAPLSAQYGYYPPAYGYGYNSYGYGTANVTQLAVNQCTAAVQARLNNRLGIAGIIGGLVGARSSGQVVSVTSVRPSSTRVRVRGLATSGRMAYNPYGYGAYGALGYNYANAADLSFRCDVDYSGRVRNVDLNRRY